MGNFGEKIGEGPGGGAYLPQRTRSYFLGVYTSVSNLVKIDEEMRP